MINPSGSCNKCGTAIKPGGRFCEACGTAVAAAPPPPSPTAPPVPPAPPAPAAPASPMPVAPAPAVCAPRRGSAGIVVGVIFAVLLVALLAVVLVWVMQHKTPPPVAGGGRQTADVPETPLTSKPDSNTTYLPAPGLRLTYHEQYVDGDEGDWELVAAQLNGQVELSSVECLDSYATAGENDVASMHYLSDADGIWKILDIRPEDRELYLPTEVTVGTTFSSSGVKGKVVAVGQTCDLGFIKLTDCLVVHRQYGEVGYEETQYFAPGYGVVLTKTGSTTMRKLTEITHMNAMEATAFVKKHTTWPEALAK